jgi:23S rRNA pseudouridine1911/1915/1917 synthase
LETAGNRSLLKIDLKTGRKHQIRIQLARIGHPVVGDRRYGASIRLPARRIALFSKEITFTHPTRLETITLASPLPQGWPWASGIQRTEAPLWGRDDFPLSLFTAIDTHSDLQ